MASSKNNASYDTLISLHDKLTRLNGMITPEAVNRLEDEFGRIITVQKHTTTSKVKNMDTSPELSPSQSTGSSLEARCGPTPYL
jgi:hypothetical protein